jgi:hypothetical protein
MQEHQPSSAFSRKIFSLSTRLALMVLCLALAGYVIYTIGLGPHAGVYPTRVTVKSESCELMQREGFVVQKYTSTATICTFTAGFRANLFTKGGEVYLDGRGFQLADHQLVATELVDEKAAILSRLMDILTLMLCSGVLLGALFALI